jgi:predicted DNA-binding transcriptional regulator AlpA
MSALQRKRYLRRRDLAERYKVTDKTVGRMIDDGRLPQPTMHNKRIPLWDESVVERHERQMLTERR